MRVLSISTDRNILDTHSAVFARQKRYSESLGEQYSIVFSLGSQSHIHDGHLHVISTNSTSKWLYGLNAIRLARTLPKPDVITVQDPFETGLVGVIIAWLLRVPLHVQVHTDFFALGFTRHSLLNRVRVNIAGFVLRRAARIRVVASTAKRHIEERYHPKADISVLPIFVDIEKFHTLKHQTHPRFNTALLFVGRLEPEKRPDIAIRALARVRKLGINAGLTIVGDGSLRSQLEQFAKKRGVATHVAFVGNADPLSHYAQADIVLVPSQYEGYSLVIIEALAAGVPVLATEVGIAREAGAIIAPHDGDGFAGELCALFARNTLPKGRLHSYPYRFEEEYIAAYTDDIANCVKQI